MQGRRAETLAALDAAMKIALRHPEAVGSIESARRNRGTVLGVLGDSDAAVAELRGLHDAGYVFGYMLRISPDYEALRPNANFQQLMKDAEARANAVPRPKK